MINVILFVFLNLYLMYAWKTFSKKFFLKKIQVLNILSLVIFFFFLYQFNPEVYLLFLTFFCFYFTEEVKERVFLNFGLPFAFFINHIFFIFASLSLFLSIIHIYLPIDFLFLLTALSTDEYGRSMFTLKDILKKPKTNNYYVEKEEIKQDFINKYQQSITNHFPNINKEEHIEQNTANAVVVYTTNVAEEINAGKDLNVFEKTKDMCERNGFIKGSFPFKKEQDLVRYKYFTQDVVELAKSVKQNKVDFFWGPHRAAKSLADNTLSYINPTKLNSSVILYTSENFLFDLKAENQLKHYYNIPDKGVLKKDSFVAFTYKGERGYVLMDSHTSEIIFIKQKLEEGILAEQITQKIPGKPLPDVLVRNSIETEIKFLNIYTSDKFEKSDWIGLEDPVKLKAFVSKVTKLSCISEALKSSNKIGCTIALDFCLLADLGKAYGYSEKQIEMLLNEALNKKIKGKEILSKIELFQTK